ncbi:MAG: hypothetical protein Q7J55_01110 [bacterium]|nr:hypothetical protein [bacterium]
MALKHLTPSECKPFIWIDPSLRQVVGQTFRFAKELEDLRKEMVSRK